MRSESKFKFFFTFIILLQILLGAGSSGIAQVLKSAKDPSSISVNYVMEFWDNSNGLPQNTVFALEKDNWGYLWIATEEGLVRFDGKSPKIFDQDAYPEMLEQTYYTFFKTQGGIWATGDRSIALLDKSILKVIDCSEIAKNTWIRAIAENGNYGLLIGNQKGEIFSYAEGVFTALPYWNPPKPMEILSFFPLDNSKLLVGTTAGLYELNLDSQQARLVSDSTLTAQKLFGRTDAIYLYTPQSGIFRLNESYGLEQILTADQSKTINPTSLVLDSDNRIWAGSLEKGLILAEKNTVSQIFYPELQNYTVRKIIKEGDNLYLGTLGRGLALVKQAQVNHLGIEELSQKSIKPIHQTNDSSIWVGTKSDGLYRIKGTQLLSLTTADGLLQNGVNTLGSSKGLVYAGSTQGISVINQQTGKVIDQITMEDGLASNYIYVVYEDSKGWVWILTRYGGIHYLDQEGTLHRVTLPESYGNTSFISIQELSNQQILIGSMNQGVFRIENGNFIQNQTLPLMPGEDVIYSIYEDEDKDLWFGTHGGIVLWKDGNFKILNKRNGLKSRSIYSLTSNGQDGLWVSHNFGIQFLSFSELKRFKYSNDPDFFIASTIYNEGQGMPNSEANGLIFPSAIRDFTQRIWIPTVEGIGIIPPHSQAEDAPDNFNFVWDELQVGEEKTSIGESIVIPAGVRMFQVSFSLIDFENPAQYSLFYRIDPKSDLWQPIKSERQLLFTGIKPGKYLLEIQILRNGKLEMIPSIPIRVSASLVETVGFKIFILLAFALLINFMVKYYFSLRMKRKLEAQVTLRTSELSQTNEQLMEALREIEEKNKVLMDITWSQSHLVRAPLTKAMGIVQLMLEYPMVLEIGKSKEELELELLEALKELDQMVRETHAKSENIKNNES